MNIKYLVTSIAALGLLASAANAQTPTVAYTADPNGAFGGAGNNGGLDIGQKFTVSGSGITIYSLGVFDYAGNGLNTSHVVALFNGDANGATLVAGGSVTVPTGTVAPLKDGFRFWPLPAPVTLAAGTYSVIVYQMNGGGGSDGYGQGATGFIGDGKLSNIGTTYNFETGAPPTFPYESSAGNLACCSFTYLPVLSAADYAPITLAPGSYNKDGIVEAAAPAPPFSVTTATMDSGTGNNNTTWYEIGANTGSPTTGIPAHGSTWTSVSLANHAYTMAADYHANDAILIDNNATTNTVAVANPTAYSALSFLCSSGGGATTFNYTVQHADGSVDSGTFTSPDWFTGGAGTAFVADGRVSVPSSYSGVNNAPNLYGEDVNLTHTSPITGITFTHNSGSGHGIIFAVSGSTGSGFSPIAITGYNEDMIVEANSETTLGGHYTSVSMDNGTANSGNGWYEIGFDRQAGITGLPNAGSTIGSAALANHYFTMAPSYAGNDIVDVDPSTTGTMMLATPGYYSSLSFLVSAGHGPITVNYGVNHADGTSEYGTFSAPDWFANTTPVAWDANGRVDVGNTSFANVNGGDPDLYSEDITLANTNSQVVSVSLSTGITGDHTAEIFALSGLAANVPPVAPANVSISPSALTAYLGGSAMFSASATGTMPFNYQWYQGGSEMLGQTNSSLVLSGVDLADATNYTCAVGNAAGTNISGSAVLTVLPLPQGVPGTVLVDGPLAYYRLNEPGPAVPDMATNYGSLGSIDNATNFPGTEHQLPGVIAGDPDTAMGYSGIDTNSCDGAYPTIIPFDASLNPNGSFTVEVWLRPTQEGNLGNAQAPMNNDFADQYGDRYGWDFFQRASVNETPDANGPGYSFRMWNGGDSGTESDNLFVNLTGGLYTIGQWSHLVAVYDASVPSVTLYFNGQQVAQSTAPNGTYYPNYQGPMSIGGYPDGTENPFSGQMDEFAIYGTALSANQVLAHYQNGTNAARSISYPSLVTSDGALEYLRLDEPAVNVVTNIGTLGSLANGVDSNTGDPVPGPQAPGLDGFELSNLAEFFNGTNDYVELLNPPGLNFTGPITLEAWVQPSAVQGSEAYVLAHGFNDNGSGEVVLRIENGQYQIASVFGRAVYTVPASDLGTGQWVYLVGTWANGQWTLYRNGVVVGTGADGVGPTVVNNANWAIGARGRWKYADFYPINGLERQFNGAIDEVAIYNHALTPARVQAHYTESMQPLVISLPGGKITLTWATGTLQSSTNVNGPYIDVSGSPASPYQPAAGPTQQFYRVRY
jgi:hypothetical protein